jgi:hypothetical protein
MKVMKKNAASRNGAGWLLTACLLAFALVLGGCGSATSDTAGPVADQRGDELSGNLGDDKDGYEPCAGKMCGDRCTICDPKDVDCKETTVLKVCNADGACEPTQPICAVNPTSGSGSIELGDPGYEPCAGKTCGDLCTICDPEDLDCVETAVVKFCHTDGGCSPTVPACMGTPEPPSEPAYEPCANKTCGARCTICDPNDPDCYETAVLKYCQADRSCRATQPACL